MSAVVADVLRDPRIWQGPRHAQPDVEPTGHTSFDAVLPGGGLPVGALTGACPDFCVNRISFTAEAGAPRTGS